ncbi:MULTISPECIES: hypothetical protein [unclassified Streptomyces]|uniref:hypothetical protein n=1 Tax=unclassified Streptomyces TaxID=2593676 RepID=UPI002E2C673C|nr:hypothetical protein [Streptomyces sp. NBC_00285]
MAKLEKKSGGDELVVSEEIKVAAKIEDAVNRIGAWNGDLFAVWDVETRPNPSEAGAIVQGQVPDSLWVISGEMPFQIEDRYLETVRQDGRG